MLSTGPARRSSVPISSGLSPQHLGRDVPRALTDQRRGTPQFDRRLRELEPGPVIGAAARLGVVEVDEVAARAELLVRKHLRGVQHEAGRDRGRLQAATASGSVLLRRPRRERGLERVFVPLPLRERREARVRLQSG